ncbi:MAG: PKD domain-containing protein [Odoribacter sp.]
MLRLFLFLAFLFIILIFTDKSILAQQPELTNEVGFKRCIEGDNKEFKLKVVNASDLSAFQENSFSLDWGDGSEGLKNVSYEALSTSHTYTRWGVFMLKVTAVLKVGTTTEQIYSVINLSKPAIGLAEGLTGISCVNTKAELTITNYGENSEATVYTLDFGDEKREVYTQQQLKMSNGKVSHTYIKTHCELGYPQGITIQVTAKNECGYENPMASPGHIIIRPPTADFDVSVKPGCIGKEVQFMDNSQGGMGKDCRPLQDLNYEWDFGKAGVGIGQENEKSPIVVYDGKGSYPVSLKIKSDAFSCAESRKNIEIQIIDTVKAAFTVPLDQGCDPLDHLVFTDQSVGDERKWKWEVTGKGINGGATMTTPVNQANAKISFHYGKYIVRQTVFNNCSSDFKDTTIQVSKNPEITRFDALPSICQNSIVQLDRYVSYLWFNNERKPEWKIEPSKGWEPILSTLKDEFPQIRFTKPGDYMLTVNLSTAGCTGNKLTASQALHIYDPTINMDLLLADRTEMCEGETVTINGSVQGEIERTDWSVDASDIFPVVLEGKTRVTIPKYGSYRITASAQAKGGCSTKSKYFDVIVRRAPEIILNDLPVYWCPINEFYPGNWVQLKKNGNETVEMHWEVLSNGAPASQVTIIGKDTGNPKIKFDTYGDYEIRVTLDYPVGGCGPIDKLTASKVLHVVNPQMSVNITSDASEFCVNGELSFTNKTEVLEGVPEYIWSVTAGVERTDYEYIAGTNALSPEPRIRFLKSGRYTVDVKVVLYDGCSHDMKSYPIVVKEDPSMVIDPLESICPGDLILDDRVVHYAWNDGWNGNAEALRKVEWSLQSKPLGAVHTPNESPEWNAHYPTLKLETPGIYVLQARLISLAGCGEKLVFSKSVEVYDPHLNIRIEPILNDDVVQLPGNIYQSLQGKGVSFVNTSTGVGLNYTWSVSPDNGVHISDLNAAQPTITFNQYGTYRVKVHPKGTCNQTEGDREFVFIVRGVPSFSLEELPNRCDDWVDSILDLRRYLRCDSAGNKEIHCNWEILPRTGWSTEEGTTLSDMFVKLKFTQKGVYTLKLKAMGAYGGQIEKDGQVKVLSHQVTTKASLLERGCTTDALDGEGIAVHFRNESEGELLKYTWSILPETGWTGNLNEEEPTVKFTSQGDYRIYLKAENICDGSEKDYSFKAFSKPEVVRLDGQDLGSWCMRDFVFRGEMHIGEIRENNDVVQVRWTVSPEGYDFIAGTATSRKPDIRFVEGDRSFRMTGKYFNHCKDTATVDFTVWMDSLKIVKLKPAEPLCAMEDSIELKATPLEGEWSLKSGYENMLGHSAGKYYFYPNRNEDLTVKAYYEYGHGTCISRDSIDLTVRELPVVNAGRDTVYCLNEGVQPLIGWEPFGLAAWEGGGVVDQHLFDPIRAGVGDFRLEYHYIDPATQCSNLDTMSVTVHGLPDPSFVVDFQQCCGIDSLFIPNQLGVGNRFTWDFSNGVTFVTEDEPATYAYPQHGLYQVRLVATSVNVCSDTSEWMPIKVLDPPPTAAFTVRDTAGCGPYVVSPEIVPAHFVGEYYDLNYLWDYGNGNISTQQLPEMQTYPASLFDTTYRMTFKVYNVCGAEIDSVNIGVWSKAVAQFALHPDKECTPVTVLFVNKSTGSHNSYVWEFGDDETATAIDTTHIYTTNTNMSVFNILLTAVNRCTPDGTKFTLPLKVKPNTIVVGFTKDKKYLCAGDTVCFENNSVDRDPAAALNYSWDFGDGQVAAVWDTCHRYENVGAYQIRLKVDNGCAHREYKDSVFVHILPVLELDGDGALCEDLELTLNVSSKEELKNIIWDFGDGSTKESGSFQMKHAFQEPGRFEVKVRGEANQIPSCPGEVSKMVEVWSKPRVKILRLDTMACPPLLYQPEITATPYDYFTWDYGDGTSLTSEMEHLYVNDSNIILGYDIKAYVENNYGCKEVHQGLIRVYNGPKAAWDKEISIGRPEKVCFINLSKDATETIWYLPFGEEVHSPENQTVTFYDEGVYPMSLAVVNRYGCRDSIYQEYRSYEGGLYFPNTFIPHSSNPKINHFNGIGVGLKVYKLEIFDAFGNKVWETNALEGGVPSEGWDGKNKNGKLLPQGVYVWRAEAIFFSEDVWTGDNNRSGKVQSTQGAVMLLRE